MVVEINKESVAYPFVDIDSKEIDSGVCWTTNQIILKHRPNSRNVCRRISNGDISPSLRFHIRLRIPRGSFNPGTGPRSIRSRHRLKSDPGTTTTRTSNRKNKNRIETCKRDRDREEIVPRWRQKSPLCYHSWRTHR
jgi:hypothetical protein